MIDTNKLGRPPGLVGDLYDWINETAGKPQPVLALAASFAYVGALGGRIYQGPGSERTNLYCVGVGPSCSGKEHARTQIKRLNAAAGVLDLMGGEDVTSDAAIEMEVERQKRVLYLWDEIGHMFGNIKGGTGGHRQTIIPMLMKLYTSANKRYEGKSYADRDGTKARRAVDQPCVCLYGTTVPERLYESMDTDQLLDGWLGRCLLFETTDNPPFDRRRHVTREIPQALIDAVSALADEGVGMVSDGSDGDIVGARTINPKTVAFTAPALDAACEFDQFAQKSMEMEQKRNTGFAPLWGRAGENATKLALVLAVGCRSSVITDEMFDYAKRLNCLLILDLKNAVADRMADSQHQRNRQKVLQVIRSAGENGITKTDLSRRTQMLTTKQRDEMLNELIVDLQWVTSVSLDGSRGTRYYPTEGLV